jgi:hypothetical protein
VRNEHGEEKWEAEEKEKTRAGEHDEEILRRAQRKAD